MSDFDKMANAFTKAEKSMQISKIGTGGYDVDHAMKPIGVHKPQSPAQHASVKKAGAASASKRKAGAGLGGNPRGKVFGF